MPRVQFLKDTSQPVLRETPRGTLVLYREGFGYGIPQIEGAEYIEFLAFKGGYTNLSPPMIIVVGLNRMITPGNRCDMVFEYLQTMTPNIPKISIDTAPFIGEPWRLWFHYSVVAGKAFGMTYSYPIEGEWQKWFYRDVDDCRFSGENIKPFIFDTISDLPALTAEFDLFAPSTEDEAWYAEIKKAVFEKRDTPKLIIADLLRAANARYNTKLSYDSYRDSHHVALPDLGIYRFMVEENLRRMRTFNAVVQYENISQ